MKRILFWISLIVIFSVGIALRASELVSRNHLFGYDQGLYYQMVADMVENHKLRLIGTEASLGSGISSVFHGPGFYYLLAIPYIVFRGDPYGGLVLMFLCGVFSMTASFFVAKKVWGSWVALLVLLFIGISPPLVAQSRFIWGPHPITLLIPILFACIYLSVKKPAIYIPVAMAIAASVYHFHLAVAVPLVISVFIFSYLIIRIHKVSVYLYSVLSLILAILPSILFDIRHGFMALKGIGAFLESFISPRAVSGNDRAYSLSAHIRDYWTNITSTFMSYGITSNFYIHIAIIFAALLLIWTGLYHTKNKQIRMFVQFLVFLVIISWFSFLFVNNTVWDYYLIPLHVAYCFLAAFAVNSIQYLRPRLRYIFLVLWVCIAICMLIRVIQVLQVSWSTDFHDLGGTAKIHGRIAAVEYIYKDAVTKPFTVLVFAPPIYSYAFDYIFRWYGKNTYGFIPEYTKSTQTYLLIEPDNDKPWSYNGWLETVVQGGTLSDTITLPSGFIIQKRSYP